MSLKQILFLVFHSVRIKRTPNTVQTREKKQSIFQSKIKSIYCEVTCNHVTTFHL